MSINIDASFIRQEILTGSSAETLPDTLRESLAVQSDQHINELITETYGNIDHPIHEALSELVRSVAALHQSHQPSQPEPLQALLKQLREVMSVPVELVGDALSIGSTRADELVEMTVIISEDVPDTIELRAADPLRHQSNLSDRSALLDMSLGDDLVYAVRAYYLKYVRPDIALKRLVTIEGSEAQALIDSASKDRHRFAATIRHALIAKLPSARYAEAYDLVDIGVLSRAPHQLYSTIHHGTRYWVHVNHEVPLCTLYGPAAPAALEHQE